MPLTDLERKRIWIAIIAYSAAKSNTKEKAECADSINTILDEILQAPLRQNDIIESLKGIESCLKSLISKMPQVTNTD